MGQKLSEIVCRDYNPDEDYNGSYGHFLAEQIMKQKENEELEIMAEFEFVKAVDKSGVNIDDEFRDRYEKEKLIRKYTLYTKLNGSGNKELLRNCSDKKIGSVLKNIYSSALNKIKRYG